MSALAVFKDAWCNRDKLGDGNNSRELAAFLPAALEIEEAPPNPLAKWLGRSLIVLFTIGLVWACFGEVNIVATAEGKIIPSSRVKQIQPLEKAVVKQILVSEGEYVTKGQPLIELDSVLTMADETRLTGELQSKQLRLAVSQAFLKLLKMTIGGQNKLTLSKLELPIENLTKVSEQDIALHKHLLWQQWLQYEAQLQALKNSRIRTKAEQAASNELILKLELTLPIVTKRTSTMKGLYDKNFASETDYLQLEQERIQQTQDLAIEKHRLEQLQAAEAEVQQQIKAFTAQAQAAQLAEITEGQRQIAVFQEELAKASDLNAKRILYSPATGQVQELAINTVGGVVTDAQQLMLIVPDEEQLEVEAFLENKDIGFVSEGMSAEIKVQTFPFTKYGVIDGEIESISNDATVDENRGLIYGMHLRMKKNTILVNGKEIKLMPGMAVTAEVQTGKRRIIEFILTPMLIHKEESIRER